ncbi:MAG: hypothetical protein M0Z60_15115 [Nitrospiraceae bacterium]|nr:hypothetical protein [Nitrospiraceae bacterium]
MPLSLNEMKDRALAFSREWAGEKAERAEAQTSWNEFFNVFGVSRRRVASLESRSAPTRKIAETPTRFHVENMPNGPYLVVPEVSSERRQDAERVACLFALYHKYTSLLPPPEKPGRGRKKRR